MEQEKLDEAWRKLQSKLAQEPVQPKWSSLPSAASQLELQHPQMATTTAEESIKPALTTEAAETMKETAKTTRLAWLQKRRKWVGLAAACCIVAAVVATPAGNEALAAILNKFRMQDVTVVQENDLRTLFDQMSPDGKTREQINKFGTFSQTTDQIQGEYDPAEAAKVYGHKLNGLAAASLGQKGKVYISPSSKLTFQIHVDEVNQAMKRLGAKKLLPVSIDGKPVTLELGETVHFNVSDDSRKQYYSFSQQPVPVITVDPSIPVAEALNAIIDFPLLPSNLKESLQQSSILSGGSIPLPVVASGTTEQLNVQGVNVIFTTQQMRESGREHSNYSATWVKDGQLYHFNGGNQFTDKAAALAKLKELIAS